jgi:hypothetical protein
LMPRREGGISGPWPNYPAWNNPSDLAISCAVKSAPLNTHLKFLMLLSNTQNTRDTKFALSITVEGITRPMKISAWRGPGIQLGVQNKDSKKET